MNRPAWLDKDPQEWPPSARIAYEILVRAAQRRMADRGPTAERPTRPVGRKRPKAG